MGDLAFENQVITVVYMLPRRADQRCDALKLQISLESQKFIHSK